MLDRETKKHQIVRSTLAANETYQISVQVPVQITLTSKPAKELLQVYLLDLGLLLMMGIDFHCSAFDFVVLKYKSWI